MKTSRQMRVFACLFFLWGGLIRGGTACASDDLNAQITRGMASIEQQRSEIRDYERWLDVNEERLLIPNPFSFPVMVPPEQLWAAYTLREREQAIFHNRPFNPNAVAEGMKFSRDLSELLRKDLRERLDDMRRQVNLEEKQVSALLEKRQRLAEERKAAEDQSPEALKEAFMQEIGALLKKWGKAWCSQGGSGCGSTPLIVYDGLRYSLPWKPTLPQITALRNRAACLDDCVMNYMGEKLDKHRSDCIKRCDAQYPVPE